MKTLPMPLTAPRSDLALGGSVPKGLLKIGRCLRGADDALRDNEYCRRMLSANFLWQAAPLYSYGLYSYGQLPLAGSSVIQLWPM